MKLTLAGLVLTSVLSLPQAQAKLDEPEVISVREVLVPVDISTAQVRLSSAGYSTPLVKVLVPGLADVTLFDHRNFGESAPCLATYSVRDPAKVIQDQPAVEQVKMKITLSRTATINTSENICEIHLDEVVEATIRGFKFDHYRGKFIATRSIEDCR